MTGGILVVGFGNRLAGDDGAGPAVLDLLRAGRLPVGARAEEGESDALRLPSLWRGEREVWLVDAVRAGGRPGSVYRLAHDDVLTVPQLHATAHQLSLPECLRWIAVSYPEMAAVRYRLWGIEPARVAFGAGLTPAVAAASRAVAAEVLAALADGGDTPCKTTPRDLNCS
jgi:hydrogenase maturation protease